MIRTMTETVQEPVVRVVEQDKVCDRCGRVASMVRDGKDVHDPVDGVYASEWLHVSYTGGWGNSLIGDLSHMEFDVCERCLSEFIEGFVHKPDIENGVLSNGNKQSWDENVSKMESLPGGRGLS